MYTLLSEVIKDSSKKEELYSKLCEAKLSEPDIFLRITENILKESGINSGRDIILLTEAKDRLKSRQRLDSILNFLAAALLILSVFLPCINLLNFGNITGLNFLFSADQLNNLYSFKDSDWLIFWNPIFKIGCGLLILVIKNSKKDWGFNLALILLVLICISDYRLYIFVHDVIHVNPFHFFSIGYYLSAPLLIILYITYSLLGYGKY